MISGGVSTEGWNVDFQISQAIEFLNEALNGAELLAIEASRDGDRFVPTGVHWHWECNSHDIESSNDLGASEFLGTPDCDCFTFSLRSREEFPTGSVGKLPAFAVHHAEEIPVAVGMHIVANDPASVIRRVEKTRQILETATPPVVLLLAESWGWGA